MSVAVIYTYVLNAGSMAVRSPKGSSAGIPLTVQCQLSSERLFSNTKQTLLTNTPMAAQAEHEPFP